MPTRVPSAWFTGYCPDHDRYTPCSKHDCPHCFIADYGFGECAHCDSHTKPSPPVGCPDGEDCPICPDCGVPGSSPPSKVTCACMAELCRECWRCPEHAADDCWACDDRYCCRDRHGRKTRFYCPGHGWVLPCFNHTDCTDRMGDVLDADRCYLKPYGSGSPTCRYCQGAGNCKYCHPHCCACWAHFRWMHEAGKGLPAPPYCAWCYLLLRQDTALLTRAYRRAQCFINPDLWLSSGRPL
jgi:hypothetical protein